MVLDAAKDVLRTDAGMKAVHSVKSVSAIVRSTKDKEESREAKVYNEVA